MQGLRLTQQQTGSARSRQEQREGPPLPTATADQLSTARSNKQTCGNESITF